MKLIIATLATALVVGFFLSSAMAEPIYIASIPSNFQFTETLASTYNTLDLDLITPLNHLETTLSLHTWRNNEKQ